MNIPKMPRNTDHPDALAELSTATRVQGRTAPARAGAMSHPVLVGDRDYLRALRAAEMAAWEAGVPLTTAACESDAPPLADRQAP